MDMRITVIDALMGTGKTSWAVNYINEHPDDNILYITPFIDETKRIKDSVQRDMYCPKNKGDGKLGDICNLLAMQEDIASTHALFLKLDNDCKDAIKQGNYTLFLDETITAIEPYNLTYKNDIDYLLKNGSIEIDKDGFIHWIDDDIDTRYNPIKILAQNHSLFYVNKKLLMWRYPPDIFGLFTNVFIMSYMFNSSILSYYFTLNGIEYDLKSIKPKDGKYVLCDYYKADVSQYKDKIHLYKKADLNDIFTQKASALSSTWFKNPNNAKKIKSLKNAVYNFFAHKEPAKSDEIIWTTFKDMETKLKGKGYSKKFLACNCRATNDYSQATHLAYCLNVYPHVGVTQFFSQHGITVDQDSYALSEMLQWIWRSNIRCGGEIWIYIPSKRMRNLLLNWLSESSK